jgi:glutamyl/glutaminyl-tRNA synthetase
LGVNQPEYAHLPLILATDRTKLSKRHGAVSVAEYRKEGYLPEALVNFLAFLGWNPGNNREIYSLNALIKDFSLEKIQKGGAVFNIKKLDFINGFYIRKKTIDELTLLCLPYLIEKALVKPISESNKDAEGLVEYFGKEFLINETEEKIGFGYLKKVVMIYQERLKKLSEIVDLTEFFFKDTLSYEKDLLRWKNMEDVEIKDVLAKAEKIISQIEENNWDVKNLEKILMLEAEKTATAMQKAGDRGYFLWPLRAALTGKKYSAGPFEIVEILGKEKTLKRINEAVKKL